MSNLRIILKLLIWFYVVIFYLIGSVRIIFFVKVVFVGIVKENKFLYIVWFLVICLFFIWSKM